MSVGVDEVVVVEDVAAVDVLADKVLRYLADVRDDTRVWHFWNKKEQVCPVLNTILDQGRLEQQCTWENNGRRHSAGGRLFILHPPPQDIEALLLDGPCPHRHVMLIVIPDPFPTSEIHQYDRGDTKYLVAGSPPAGDLEMPSSDWLTQLFTLPITYVLPPFGFQFK
jgi:hypothetical protein